MRPWDALHRCGHGVPNYGKGCIRCHQARITVVRLQLRKLEDKREKLATDLSVVEWAIARLESELRQLREGT